MAAVGARLRSIEERNRALDRLAAADALHDFGDMARVEALRAKAGFVENAFQRIWAKTREIGTRAVPETEDPEVEDAIFRRITGLTMTQIKEEEPIGAAPKSHTVLEADRDSIRYNWKVIKVSTKGEGRYTYHHSSAALYAAITGDPTETSFYFTVDAAVTKFYEGLVQTDGPMQKKAFYVKTREGINDALGKLDLSPYVKASRTGKTVSIEVVDDDYAFETSYTPMAAGSTEPTTLFDSVYSLSLSGKQAKTTKEGLEATTLTFRKRNGDEVATVTSQEGALNTANNVTTLYDRLMRLAGLAPATFNQRKDAYFTLLQQKRSGDWLQVLATFDAKRFRGVPVGMPIYTATSDRLCLAYGLCVGAPMIYAFYRGSDYYITVFRPDKGETLGAAEVLRAQILGELGGHTGETVPISCGGTAIPYRELMNTYRAVREEIIAKLVGEIAGARRRIEGAFGERQLTRFDASLGLVFATMRLIAGTYELFPVLSPVTMTRLRPFASQEVADTEDYREEAAQRRQELETLKQNKRWFAETFGGVAFGAEGLRSAMFTMHDKLFARLRQELSGLGAFSLTNPFYETGWITILQLIHALVPAGERAALGPILQEIQTDCKGQISAGMGSDRRAIIEVMLMNCRVFRYLVMDDVAALPSQVIPSFARLLEKAVEPTKAPARGFAIFRIIAATIRNAAEKREKAAAVRAFMTAYAMGGGARSKGSRIRSRFRVSPRREKVLPLFRLRTEVNVCDFVAPYTTIYLYVRALNKLIAEMRVEHPMIGTAMLLLGHISKLIQPGAWLEWWGLLEAIPEFAGRIAGIPEEIKVYLYHSCISTVLTNVLPLEEGAALLPDPKSDVMDLTRAINMEIFGAPILQDTDESVESTFFNTVLLSSFITLGWNGLAPSAVSDVEMIGFLREFAKVEQAAEGRVVTSSGTRSRARSRSRSRTRSRPRSRARTRSRSRSRTRGVPLTAEDYSPL